MARSADKDKSKYVKKDYKKEFKELNLLQAEAAHHKSKYENLNKAFTKSKTYKYETVYLYASSGSNSSPSSESKVYSLRTGKKKPQSPMIRILLTMAKSEAVPLAARTAIESTVSESPLS